MRHIFTASVDDRHAAPHRLPRCAPILTMTDTPTAFVWAACYAASVCTWAGDGAYRPDACACSPRGANTKRQLLWANTTTTTAPIADNSLFPLTPMMLHKKNTAGEMLVALAAPFRGALESRQRVGNPSVQLIRAPMLQYPAPPSR